MASNSRFNSPKEDGVKLAALLLALAICLPAHAQSPSPDVGPWQALNFLKGTWEAKTAPGAVARVSGTYSFQADLKGHVLSRYSSTADCKGPRDFDCQHSDLFYVYEDASGAGLRAIYFDSEGHVIHYSVLTPDPTTAVFLSIPGPGPRFRLVYHLEGTVMSGKFQSQPPTQSDWVSYLEWSGRKL